MNAQRWVALGIGILVVVCLATSNIWLPTLLEEDEDEATSTPTQAVIEGEEAAEEATLAARLDQEPTPTLDPVIADLLAEAEMEIEGARDDPYIVYAGDFSVIDSMHRGEGSASIWRLQENVFVLRLDPFSVSNGPDLHVILSLHEEPRTSADAILPRYIDLGSLKNTDGAQNYDIPPGIYLEQYKSVVVYSMSLNIVYTSANITSVRGVGP